MQLRLTHHGHVHEEIEHLKEVAERGDEPETPFIVLSEVVLFLIPIVAVVLGLAFLAYYLAS